MKDQKIIFPLLSPFYTSSNLKNEKIELNPGENNLSGLEGLLRNIPGPGDFLSKEIRKSSPPVQPNFEAEYMRMREYAETEDDFRRVLDIYFSVLRSDPFAKARATEVLEEVFTTYGKTQERLAGTYAAVGDFEETEKHIENACSRYIVERNSARITLDPRIAEERITEIINEAIKNTQSSYFLKQALKAAEAGKTKDAGKYCSLMFSALKIKGVEQFYREIGLEPDSEESSQGRVYKIKEIVKQIRQKAYQITLHKNLEEAVGHAIGERDDGIIRIEELREKAINLIEEYWKIFARTQDTEDSGITMVLNGIIHPFYDALKDVCEDKGHPLRRYYKPKKDGSYSWSKIVGYETKEIGTELVPRRFYEEAYQRTGIPIMVTGF